MENGKSVITLLPLPCGCQPGQAMCAEALRLWNVSVQLKFAARGAQTEAAWLRYEAAQKDYVDHFLKKAGDDGN